MKTIAAILAVCFVGVFCFAAIWAVLMDKQRRRQWDDERELGKAVLTKVEPCWKSCAYKYTHERLQGLTKE